MHPFGARTVSRLASSSALSKHLEANLTAIQFRTILYFGAYFKMQINLSETTDIQAQAVAAGFANVEEYVLNLIERDKERVAIQEGLDAIRDGRLRPFEEFDAEFRRQQ